MRSILILALAFIAGALYIGSDLAGLARWLLRGAAERLGDQIGRFR